jgi:hypothetical protein
MKDLPLMLRPVAGVALIRQQKVLLRWFGLDAEENGEAVDSQDQ